MSPARALAARVLAAPLDGLAGYDAATLRRDATAGLSVAVVGVPQALAYALIAGVPPEYGLYTLIVQSLIGSLFGSQPLLAIGPTNTQSLLVAAIATRAVALVGGPDPAQPGALYLQIAIALTLIKGVLQLGMAAAGLGALVRYVSQAVIVGFTSGAGVLIGAGQVGAFVGMRGERAASDGPGLIGAAQRLWAQGLEVSPAALGVGLLALAVVLVGRQAARRFSVSVPGPLLAVAAAGLAVFVLGYGAGDLPLIAGLPAALPGPAWPQLGAGWIELLLPGALALSLLGLMESYAIGKSLAVRTGTSISANHELVSQGLTGVVSSLFGCIPGSGSFGRSELNYRSGAATRYAGVFQSVWVAAILLLFAPLAGLVPLSALAAILFVIAWDLVDVAGMRRLLRTSRSDAIVCGVTFAATLLLPLAWAVFVGVGLNVALYLRGASQLHLSEMRPRRDGSMDEIPLDGVPEPAPVVLLQLEGNLFFGLADELETRLQDVLESDVRVVVLRLKRTQAIDSSALDVLDRFARAMRARGRWVILCGLRPDLARRARAFGLAEAVGEDNVFETRPGVFQSVHDALERARRLAGEDTGDTLPEGLSWDI